MGELNTVTCLVVAEYTMCLCGEIIVPHENTALSGDLQVDVLGITTSSCVQLLERSLYPPEDETEYLVLGSAVVQRSRAGDPSTQRGVHLRSHRHLCFMSRFCAFDLHLD
ncbi:hypothetical protein J6590_096521 [Homalodisca vitripennis]|nr:hypothetical protein J6590_096521 [Homalodisca vitripennis]